MSSIRLAIFASGNGSNAENITHYFNKHPHITITVMVSNKSDAYVLKRARKCRIPSVVISNRQLHDQTYMTSILNQYQVTHIVLAGFLVLIPAYLVDDFSSRMINIHPALLPQYGGLGMYGHHVHRAVKEAGEVYTGITIHEVNQEYDKGRIVFQSKVRLEATDTVEDIAKKVHELEYRHYPRVIEKWALSSSLHNGFQNG